MVSYYNKDNHNNNKSRSMQINPSEMLHVLNQILSATTRPRKLT